MLDPAQKKAAESDAAFKIVVAGPGSGKTSTLVHAIRHDHEKHDARGMPADACVITYTNAAAMELKERLTGTPVKFIGTLHSVMFTLLKRHHKIAGFHEAPALIDEEQSLEILELEMKDQASNGVKLSEYLKMLKDPRLVERPEDGRPSSNAQLIVMSYHRTLRENCLVDFNGILYYGEKLLKCEEVGKAFPRRVYWDEVQDSSDEDWRILQAMPAESKTIVGDPDQAIFGFRGGNVLRLLSAIDLAEQTLTEPERIELHVLETNYRSEPAICEHAQNLIQRNRTRFNKRTLAAVDAALDTGEVRLVEARIPAEEFRGAIGIVQQLEAPPKEIAVLARTNYLAKEMRHYLASAGIAVKSITRTAQDSKELSVVMRILAALENPSNDFTVWLCLRAVYGAERANEIKKEARLAGKGLNSHMGMPFTVQDTFQVLRKVHGFGIARHALLEVSEAASLALSKAAGIPDGSITPADIAYELKVGREEQEQNDDGMNAVTVTTMHNAKGREWDHVVIIGAEENICPHKKQSATPQGVEEERRLFYVAMTRARKSVTISHCKNRPENRGPNMAPGPLQKTEPSRFIHESFSPQGKTLVQVFTAEQNKEHERIQ